MEKEKKVIEQKPPFPKVPYPNWMVNDTFKEDENND